MDTLPPEIISLIADFVQHHRGLFSPQRNLAFLARTNKTLHSICNTKLYQDAVLDDGEALRKWSRVYLSKVNPFTFCRGTEDLESMMIPKKISFRQRTTRDRARIKERNRTAKRSKPKFEICPVVHNRFTPFFFRNLTSISISTQSPVIEDFVAALVGPVGPNRSVLQQFTILIWDSNRLPSFVFEALNRSPELWDIWDDACLPELLDELGTTEERQRIEKELEEDYESVSGDDWELLHSIALKLAPTRYSVISQMGPNIDYTEERVRAAWIRTRNVECHPFQNLTKLSIYIGGTIQIQLLLDSRLFPSLYDLEFSGIYDGASPVEDIKLLRRSITDRPGKIIPPIVVKHSFIDAFGHPSWEPLSEKELAKEPRTDYHGPRLQVLDLSDWDLEWLPER